MPMQKVTEQDGQSANIVDENIEQMKALFPDAFTEGGVDFDVLRQLLGDASVLDEGEEKYGLNWHGKKQARQIALTPSTGTLLPCPDESVNWNTTQNIFIEGDNLEVLKLLQKSYANSVKMVYIDPPYNTDGDFVYPDRFKEGLSTYLHYTGQKIEGEWSVSKSGQEVSGRRHAPWLSMMLPRLKIAKNILRRDGVIFVSIDDNEQAHLRAVLDEIFGAENFEGHIHWRRRHNQPNDPTKMLGLVAEHILVYAKDSAYLKSVGVGKVEVTGSFSNPDNDPRGDWATKPWKVGSDQSGSRYAIKSPNGAEFDEEWMGDQNTFNSLLNDNRMIFTKGGDGLPRKKYFKFEREEEGQCATNWWPHDQFGHNQAGNEELTEIFGEKNVFSNPKPTKLIENLISVAGCRDGDIVLDFFAGSATTAHAVLKSNIKDLKFVLVQLPEKISDTGKQSVAFEFCKKNELDYNIAALSRERIRRVIARQKNSISKDDEKPTIGFRVYRLANSNINAWNPDRTDLEATLLSHKDHLVEGRSEQDVLYELLLKRGIELTVPIEEKKAAGKTIYSIGYGVMFACLDTSIAKGDVDAVAGAIAEWHKELEPETDSHVFFRDSAFADDIAKTNMAAILEQNGIAHVRSL